MGPSRVGLMSVRRLWLPVLLWLGLQAGSAAGAGLPPDAREQWRTLLAQADALGLPTRFLRAIPPDFITLEFEDLHAFAAEYHPAEHRMVLNLALSFNAAGGTLKPLAKMTPREAGTLFHEFFHAYMDYVRSKAEAAVDPGVARLLAFAQDQQRCRYQVVSITPVVQRKSATEVRFLSDREAWEALDETWAVFVGWAVWSRLEQSHGQGVQPRGGRSKTGGWPARLEKADRDGDLVGYYEPEDPAERTVAQKRYLASSHRITPREVAVLLEVLFGESREGARRAVSAMEQKRLPLKDSMPCPDR
ncbi:MAG: hypothetical protein HY205_07895 [Nitrospirae bacterium]|nr:hypothetical protein [Nitrospirota bacterium]